MVVIEARWEMPSSRWTTTRVRVGRETRGEFNMTNLHRKHKQPPSCPAMHRAFATAVEVDGYLFRRCHHIIQNLLFIILRHQNTQDCPKHSLLPRSQSPERHPNPQLQSIPKHGSYPSVHLIMVIYRGYTTYIWTFYPWFIACIVEY